MRHNRQEGGTRRGLWSGGRTHGRPPQPTGPCPQATRHHHGMYSSFLLSVTLLCFDQVICRFNGKLSKISPALVSPQRWEPVLPGDAQHPPTHSLVPICLKHQGSKSLLLSPFSITPPGSPEMSPNAVPNPPANRCPLVGRSRLGSTAPVTSPSQPPAPRIDWEG